MYRKKDSDSSPAITSNLAALRKRRAISAAGLASAVGISRQAIYAIENGSYIPNTAVGMRVARVLGVSMEELFELPADSPANGPKAISALALPGSGPMQEGQAVHIFKLRGKLMTAEAAPAFWYFPASDGVIAKKDRAKAGYEVQLSRPEEEVETRVVLAGCDPAMSLLANCFEVTGNSVILLYRNSSASLELLKEGFTHIAGSHLRGDDANLSAVKRLLPNIAVAVVSFAFAQEGLLTASGNPKDIRDVDDLARKDVELINRDAGSGSRTLLDQRLKKVGLSGKNIRGYSKTAPGHLAAAWEVKTGNADCCVATEACARFWGLHFIPFEAVRYDMIVRKSDLKLAPVSSLFDFISQLSFRRKLASLGGYETSVTGKRVQ